MMVDSDMKEIAGMSSEEFKSKALAEVVVYNKIMKNIVFYISDHGFGHASRNIPIIRYILGVKNNIKIHIKTGINQGLFIKDSLKDLKIVKM